MGAKAGGCFDEGEGDEGRKEGSDLSHHQPHRLRTGPQEVFEKIRKVVRGSVADTFDGDGNVAGESLQSRIDFEAN